MDGLIQIALILDRIIGSLLGKLMLYDLTKIKCVQFELKNNKEGFNLGEIYQTPRGGEGLYYLGV